jgi:hypothetical protein
VGWARERRRRAAGVELRGRPCSAILAALCAGRCPRPPTRSGRSGRRACSDGQGGPAAPATVRHGTAAAGASRRQCRQRTGACAPGRRGTNAPACVRGAFLSDPRCQPRPLPPQTRPRWGDRGASIWPRPVQRRKCRDRPSERIRASDRACWRGAGGWRPRRRRHRRRDGAPLPLPPPHRAATRRRPPPPSQQQQPHLAR